jgi:hypothetical protein
MQRVLDFYNKHKAEFVPLRPATQEAIVQMEQALGFEFDEQLREYLSVLGAVSYGAFEMTGIGYSDSSYRNMVGETLRLRRRREIPARAVVLEHWGEDCYFIYIRLLGVFLDCPGAPPSLKFPDLEDYILARLAEA